MNLTDASEVTAMVEGYLRTALWATPVEREDGECQSSPFNDMHNPPLEQLFCFEDIVHALSECRHFCEYVADVVEEQGPSHHPNDNANALALEALEAMDPAQAGHDFWLNRERHGTGFWDRGLGVAGTRLSDAAKTFGEGGLAITYQSPDFYDVGFGNGQPPGYRDDSSDGREKCGYFEVMPCLRDPRHVGAHALGRPTPR